MAAHSSTSEHFHPLPTKPSLHLQEYPPGRFIQYPPKAAQLCSPVSHSLISVHSNPSPTKPFLHSHSTEPTVLEHEAFGEQGLSALRHSSLSEDRVLVTMNDYSSSQYSGFDLYFLIYGVNLLYLIFSNPFRNVVVYFTIGYKECV